MYSGNLYMLIKFGPNTNIIIRLINKRRMFVKQKVFIYVLLHIFIFDSNIKGLKI